MKNLFFGLFAALVFLFSNCKTSQKLPAAPPVVPTEKALLWRIDGPKMKKPSYIFGTVHMIPKKDFDLSDAAETALFSTKKIVYEINLDDMTSIAGLFKMFPKAMMSGGKTLKSLLSVDEYALVKTKFEEKGMSVAMFERLKPMFTGMALADESKSAGQKMDKMTAVEMELQKLAKRRKMESGGLETVELQMAVFDSIPYAAQARMLVQSLEKGTDLPENDEFAGMIEAYVSQDIEKMSKLVEDENAEFAEFSHFLIGDRNRRWIPKMTTMMREKPTFFAVGAGHLGGSEGVIFLLRQAGFSVSPVLSN